MGQNDFQINAQVRAILARHWISLSPLRANALNGVLYLRGTIRFLPGRERVAGEVNADLLTMIDRELTRIPLLRSVRWQLDNWDYADGVWLPKGGQRANGKS